MTEVSRISFIGYGIKNNKEILEKTLKIFKKHNINILSVQIDETKLSIITKEKESDILELIDQFGGMLLDRPERIGFKPDEALVLLEHRNLKGEYNRYLDTFMNFVDFIEKINMSGVTSMPALKRLYKIH